MGWGDGKVAGVLGLLIVGLVVYLSVSKADTGQPATIARHRNTDYAPADADFID
jgi:hypothetical protein